MPRARIVPQTLSLVLLALTAPAAAQYGAPAAAPVPQARPEQPGDSAAPAAAATSAPLADVIRAAACSVARDARPAVALLGTAPFSAEERTQAGNFMRGAQRCLRQREPIVTSAYLARGAIAEALYEVQFATAPAARTPALAAGPLPRPGADLPAESVQQLAPMYGLADCATPRQPELVRAVLATEPRGADEAAALAALHPAFAACVPAGSRLTYDPRFMRSFLAEALYRWAVVQRDGAASAWAAPAAATAPSGQ